MKNLILELGDAKHPKKQSLTSNQQRASHSSSKICNFFLPIKSQSSRVRKRFKWLHCKCTVATSSISLISS